MTHEAKFKIGDVVLACHSGKAYKITEAWALDEHGSFGYAARGWRGGKLYGATRRFAESGLQPSTSPFSEAFPGQKPRMKEFP